jgi:hypothetical protein
MGGLQPIVTSGVLSWKYSLNGNNENLLHAALRILAKCSTWLRFASWPFHLPDTIKSGARGAAKNPVWQEEERLGINPVPGVYKRSLLGPQRPKTWLL